MDGTGSKAHPMAGCVNNVESSGSVNNVSKNFKKVVIKNNSNLQ
jgi:hypothetical protein